MPTPSLYDVLDKWKNQELNAARLYSAAALQHPSYQRAKLTRFRSLAAEYGLDRAVRQELGFIALRSEIKVLERTLYPHPLQRLLQRALAGVAAYLGPERLLVRERRKLETAMQASPFPGVMPAKADARTAFAARLQEAYAQAMAPSTRPGVASLTGDVPTPPTTMQQNDVTMNTVNYGTLAKTIDDLGFGKGLDAQLQQEMQKGQDKFVLVHRTPGNEERTAYLNFSKQANGDYSFNNYRMSVKNPQFAEAVKQTFFINPGEKNVTLEQATNLLQSRAVQRELTTREGKTYQAWQQLDFAVQQNGNFKVRSYGEGYGFDFNKVMERYHLAEMNDPAKASVLKEALRNGNRVEVTATIGNETRPVLMQAEPRFKTMQFMELNGVKLKAEKLLKPVAALGAAMTEGQVPVQQQQAGEQQKPPRKGKKQQGLS